MIVEIKNDFITYKIKGGRGEYISHIQAITAALSSKPLNDENRAALAHLLEEILPNEKHLQIE